MASLNRVLGSVLAERRRNAAISQEELAFACDLHPTYISQLERGLKSPTVRVLFAIAKNLKVKPSEIMRAVEERRGKLK